MCIFATVFAYYSLLHFCLACVCVCIKQVQTKQAHTLYIVVCSRYNISLKWIEIRYLQVYLYFAGVWNQNRRRRLLLEMININFSSYLCVHFYTKIKKKLQSQTFKLSGTHNRSNLYKFKNNFVYMAFAFFGFEINNIWYVMKKKRRSQ